MTDEAEQFHKAVYDGDTEKVNQFVERFHRAVYDGDIERVTQYLDIGINPNSAIGPSVALSE